MKRQLKSAIIGTAMASILLIGGSAYLLAQGGGQRGQGQGQGMRTPPSADQIFAREDKDGDGQISKKEFGGPAEHFANFDTDGDGYLTRKEVTASLKNPPPNGEERRNQGAPPRQQERPELNFTDSDTNGDGVLSAEEFTGPADHFSLLDANADGVLTEEEFADARNRLPSPQNSNR